MMNDMSLYSSSIDCLAKAVKQEGFMSLYKGKMSMILYVLMCHMCIKRHIDVMSRDVHAPCHACSVSYHVYVCTVDDEKYHVRVSCIMFNDIISIMYMYMSLCQVSSPHGHV